MGELGQGVARVGTISWDQRGGGVGTKSGDKTIRTGELGPESWESYDQEMGQGGQIMVSKRVMKHTIFDSISRRQYMRSP